MSAAELRDLANVIPLPQGGARNLAASPDVSAQADLREEHSEIHHGTVRRSTSWDLRYPWKWSILARVRKWLRARITGQAAKARLMLISYPTPQIATEHLASHRAGASTATHRQGNPRWSRWERSRRSAAVALVAVATGTFTQNEAENLVNQVHYDADVTWNENTFFDKKNNVANLLWNAVLAVRRVDGHHARRGSGLWRRASRVEALAPQRNQGPEAGLHLAQHR